jgi:hypothetical protein
MSLTYKHYLIMVAATVAAVLIGVLSIHWMGSDNAVEEAAEQVILDQTGMAIDLSPGSPEAAK